MTDQGDLFDVGRKPELKGRDKAFAGEWRAPDGSRDALEYMETSGKLKGHEAHVLAVLGQHPGSTSAELAEHTEYDLTETRRRLSGLKDKGLVEKCGPRMCRVAGNKQATWRKV